MNTTISEQHLSKTAYVYVRQSTLAQVRHHQESTERQCCGMREKALQLGWLDGSDFGPGIWASQEHRLRGGEISSPW